jgi:hypothetical protein
MQTGSPATRSDPECTLSAELAAKGARELQESFESAVHGEDGDGDDGMEDGGGDSGEDGEGDNDSGGVPAAMDVETPGSSTLIISVLHLSDLLHLDWHSLIC